MGHAGAIVSGGKGTAEAKFAALDAAGIRTTRNASELGRLVKEALAEHPCSPDGAQRNPGWWCGER
jgi:succinyl-CoA synthetase alpha subunit